MGARDHGEIVDGTAGHERIGLTPLGLAYGAADPITGVTTSG
jgi:hypothetical protein